MGFCVNLAKNITMEKINEFCYEENGVKIVFNELPKAEHHVEPYFEFEVSDDAELTEKLRNAVRNKQVQQKSFFDCANALFAIITSGDFEEVATPERTIAAFQKFKELVYEDPKFLVKRISTDPPKSMVRLINSLGFKGVEAEARNVLTAKVVTLEKYINLMG